MSESTPDRPSDQMPEGDDIARKHGEQILEMLTADKQERDKELFEVFNEAWRSEAEAEQADK